MTFRVQNLLKIVITFQITTFLLVVLPNLIVLPYPNLRITLSNLTYFLVQTAISTQTRPQALNRAMRTKLAEVVKNERSECKNEGTSGRTLFSHQTPRLFCTRSSCRFPTASECLEQTAASLNLKVSLFVI